MNRHENKRFKRVLYILLALTVVLMTLLSAQAALANVRLENDGQVPFYARIERYEVFHTDEWAAIVFYRPPSCIPDDFNLLDFFDIPAVFDCQPATTYGFEVWKNGPPPIDVAPIQSVLHGRGAVPVWFVSWSELETALGDDMLTITELEAMTSLVEGSATYFHETLHPSESTKNSMINYVASGSLEGGGSFWVHASAFSASGRINTQISLEE